MPRAFEMSNLQLRQSIQFKLTAYLVGNPYPATLHEAAYLPSHITCSATGDRQSMRQKAKASGEPDASKQGYVKG